MKILENPYFSHPSQFPLPDEIPAPSTEEKTALQMIASWQGYAPTPLLDAPELARMAGIAQIQIKDESKRFELGNFKALGAAYVIAQDAQKLDLSQEVYVCASAGNHGLSVAWGARNHGAKSVVYIDQNVPEVFAERLQNYGAHVVRYGEDYEAAMQASKEAAKAENWRLLSDQSWEGYSQIPHQVLEGYLVMMAEAIAQLSEPPSHIFLQAGVGGLAAASAALARKIWGNAPQIIVVEPALAPALYGSIAAGHAQKSGNGVSNMGRLDCKEPSLIALKGLAQDANIFALIDEDEALNAVRNASAFDFQSTPSGLAGLAGLLSAEDHRHALELDENSRALIFMSEGAL